MQIINPSVKLLAYTKLINDDTPSSPSKLIELAMRNCYKSEDKITENSYKKIIPSVVSLGHTSTIEHVNFTFRIITSRDVLQELVRHRIASYSVESTRYCNYTSDKKGMQFIKPAFVSNEDLDKAIELYKYSKSDLEKLINSDKLSNDIKCIFRWLEDIKTAETSYNYMIKNGWKPQQARAILPGCLKTEIVMTMNCRSLLNFIKLRTSNSAHPDIIVVAKEIEKIVTEICPEIFKNQKLK